MKRYFYACAPVVALLLAGTVARADPSTPDAVQWTYNFTPTLPGNPGVPITAITADGNPNAGVTLTNDLTKTAVGSSDVVATNLRVFISPGTPPQSFVTNGGYGLALVLTMTDSNGLHTATLNFSGSLGGTFSTDNANITNTPFATQTAGLGDWNFTVSGNPFAPPGPPDQTQAGAIGFHVAISTLSITTVSTPEPSTMLLSGLGMSFLGFASWRKRRAKARLALVA